MVDFLRQLMTVLARLLIVPESLSLIVWVNLASGWTSFKSQWSCFNLIHGSETQLFQDYSQQVAWPHSHRFWCCWIFLAPLVSTILSWLRWLYVSFARIPCHSPLLKQQTWTALTPSEKPPLPDSNILKCSTSPGHSWLAKEPKQVPWAFPNTLQACHSQTWRTPPYWTNKRHANMHVYS